MKQKLTEIKEEIDKTRIAFGDLNTPISKMIKETDISKDIENLNTVNQLDLNDIFRRLYSIIAEYTFVASVFTTFTNLTICWVIIQV